MADGGESQENTERAVLAAVRQFVVSSHEMLRVGASHTHGTSALSVDESLRTLSLGVSDTFANALPLSGKPSTSTESDEKVSERTVVCEENGVSVPVCVRESESEAQFTLRDVEVFCGRTALLRCERFGGAASERERASVLGDVANTRYER